MDLTQIVIGSCAAAVTGKVAEHAMNGEPSPEWSMPLLMQNAIEQALRKALAAALIGLRVKGDPLLMWDIPQSANGLSDYAVDCRGFNALHVHVLASGTTPSATISVEGGPGEGGNFVPLSDPNASRANVSVETAFDVMVGSPFARVRIASISGTFGAGLGYTIRCTPYIAAAQPSATRYGTPTHTTATVTTSSSAALAASGARRYALFINDSDTTVYLMIGATAVANQGIRLNAYGGSYEMSAEAGNLNTGAVNAIHAGTGNKVLLVLQGT